jgi:catechol 2,3-dioxygenase-like lactoylglutathione lyase family enzyme
MLTGIAHVNLTVPPDTLDQAEAFYSKTLGMQRVPVPALQKDRLAWYVLRLQVCESQTFILPKSS